jgi:phosphatidylserine/phosphatidylglycerophosphate/cardiolipin synthase-like enzyme
MISVIRNAQRSIYIEDQYLVELQAARELRKRIPVIQSLTIVIPHSSLSDLPQTWKRRKDFIDTLTIGLSPQNSSKVKIYYLRDLDINGNRIFGSYSYVHSKTWIIDDEVAIIGSANCNRRGWSYDTEVIAAIYNPKLASNLHTSLLRLHDRRLAPYIPTEDYDRFPPPLYSDWDNVYDPVAGESIPTCSPQLLPLPACPSLSSRLVSRDKPMIALKSMQKSRLIRR